MAELVLGGGTRVVLSAPAPPVITMTRPSTTILAVPVRGPAGPRGDAGDGTALAAHIESPTPHPVYDDLPSLTLLYENGLV